MRRRKTATTTPIVAAAGSSGGSGDRRDPTWRVGGASEDGVATVESAEGAPGTARAPACFRILLAVLFGLAWLAVVWLRAGRNRGEARRTVPACARALAEASRLRTIDSATVPSYK